MSRVVISVENLSKSYRLGQFDARSLREEAQAWWARRRGRPNPLAPVGAAATATTPRTLWALDDVSFTVEQGEVLGVIGRNGAGKSTLLKVLGQVTAPTRGVVKMRGSVASLLEVGAGFHFELTGRENIFLNGAILGMSTAEVRRKFDEIVAFAELAPFIDTPIKRYSSGMYVRLAFAVAAHLEPDILLIDEVLAVGDSAFQKKCLGKIGSVARAGRTVIFVSHDMSAIRTLCTHAAWIDGGRFVYKGETQQAIERYLAGKHSLQAAWLDLRDWRDRSGSGPARVEALGFCDASGQAAVEFRQGQPLEVRVRVRYPARTLSPDCALTVLSPGGEALFTTRLADSLELDADGPGLVEYRALLDPNLLAPGSYGLSIRAGRANSLVPDDRVEDAPGFTVLDVPHAAGAGLGSRRGLFRVGYAWKREKIKHELAE